MASREKGGTSFRQLGAQILGPLVEVEVVEGISAVVTMREDSDGPVFVRQHVPYTDFPFEKFSFYCVDNVMMLKSEY